MTCRQSLLSAIRSRRLKGTAAHLAVQAVLVAAIMALALMGGGPQVAAQSSELWNPAQAEFFEPDLIEI